MRCLLYQIIPDDKSKHFQIRVWSELRFARLRSASAAQGLNSQADQADSVMVPLDGQGTRGPGG
jgi:hypothetical protein